MYRNSGNVKTIPGLRRSSSSSNIPTLTRTNSSTNLVGRRDSSRPGSVTKNNEFRYGSAVRGRPPSLDRGSYLSAPPQRQPSLDRGSNLRTPISGVRASRSPFKPGTAKRDVNDKVWIQEQFIKVKRYLLEYHPADEAVVANLKPINTETFVYVVDKLFKEIDPRMNITRLNYQLVVPEHLKLWKYSGNISKSLFKTVNTKHCWPSVISILGWLVDVATMNVSEKLEEEMVGLNYLSERYNLFNRGLDETDADTKFIEILDQYLGIDKVEYEAQKMEILKLTNEKEQFNLRISDLDEKISYLKNATEVLRKEVNEFSDENVCNEEKLKSQLDDILEKRTAIGSKLKNKQDSIKILKETISEQNYSYDDKTKILSDIIDLNHSIKLKKKDIKSMFDLKDRYDYKSVKVKHKIEEQISRINRAMMHCALLNPEYKNLHLREKGFLDKDFESEVDLFLEKYKLLEENMKQDFIVVKKDVEDEKANHCKLLAFVDNLKIHNEHLRLQKQQILSKINQIKHDHKEATKECNQLCARYDADNVKLQNQEPDLKTVNLKLQDLSQMKADLIKKHDEMQLKSLELLTDLHNMSMENLEDIKKIGDGIEETVDNKVMQQQKDMENLVIAVMNLNEEAEKLIN